MVHLDPRSEGVVVPEWFKSDPALRLNIAYGFNLPSLDIDEEGIYAVLSFGGQNHGCTVPWSAVFAITLPQDQQDGQVWPSSLPKELLEPITAVEAASKEVEAAKSGPQLRVVQAEEAEVTPVLKAVVAEENISPVSASPVAAVEPPTEPAAPVASSGRAKLRLVTD